jgi:hypothetical protein
MLFAGGSPRKLAEARTLLTIFYGFLDNFFNSFICFALYAVQSSSMQYKTLWPVLRGGGGGGGAGVSV